MGKEKPQPQELKTYLVLRPIAMGGRVDAGSQIQITEAEANNYPPDFLKEVQKEVAPEPPKEVKTDVVDAGSPTAPVDGGSSAGSAGDQSGQQPKTVDHVVIQQDLDANPDLAATGVAVGQTIQIPATE